MKKATYTVLTVLAGMVSLMSCKKLYHCTCTFNQQVMYTKDLGKQHEDDAKSECSSFDSTITGEVWNCQIY
jgi:hypothetical protein